MSRARFFSQAAPLIAGLLLFAVMAFAQTVQGQFTLSWTLPTVDANGAPITPASALTAVEVYASTSPIADNATLAPLAVLGVGVVTSQQSIPVANGSTVYFRLKAVNAAGKSVFSTQASKLVDVAVPLGAPTNFIVNLVLTPAQ